LYQLAPAARTLFEYPLFESEHVIFMLFLSFGSGILTQIRTKKTALRALCENPQTDLTAFSSHRHRTQAEQ
jgi:hypothetical protein